MKTHLKKIILLLSILTCTIFSLNNSTFALEIKIGEAQIDYEKELTFEEILNFFGDEIKDIVPKSSEYIELKFRGVPKDSKLYQSLQRLVYIDRIENKDIYINKNTSLSQYAFFKLGEKIFDLNVSYLDEEGLKKQITTYNEIEQIKDVIDHRSMRLIGNGKQEVQEKQKLFSDVYSTILNNHYNKENLSEVKIIESAIEGLTKGTGDQHTVYFPPIESESFHDNLSGEYEGIGSYVDMEKPGLVKIVTPISGSPSEKAGLKGGDRIIAVDEKEVTEQNSLNEVISWIKGPAGTQVTLTIQREEEELKIVVTREKIVINDVEYELLNNRTFYIQIKSFGEKVGSEFKAALENLKENTNVNKLIIDLRNNGGGYLTEVAKMLGYFIESGEPTAVVKYSDYEKKLLAEGHNFIDLGNYQVVLLQNSGTASASEIMIGTIKDYYPESTIIGEKSYGKGSVQTMKNYSDGSTIKYTIAKWFTGKTQTGIDGVGIEPTIELEFDREYYQETGKDNQLEKAKNIQ